MVVSDDLTKKEKEVYELVMSKLGHNPSENQPPRKSRFSVLQHEDPFEELIPKR